MLSTVKRAVKNSLAKRAMRRGDIARADRLDNELAADRYNKLVIRAFDRGVLRASESAAAQVMVDAYERAAKYAIKRIHDGRADFIERRLAVPGTEGHLPMSMHNSIIPVIDEAHRAIKDDWLVYSDVQFEKMRIGAPLVIKMSFLRRQYPRPQPRG